MSSLRIAMIAPPWIPLPPNGYGGIELVVELLARELLRRGHDVTVFSCAGSDPALNVVALAGGDWFEDLGGPDQRVREATYLRRVYDNIRNGRFDLVHDHTEYPGIALAHSLRLPLPVIATMHGWIGPKQWQFLREVHGQIGLAAISETQKATAPGILWDAVVHNAIDTESLRFSAQKADYLLQIARINPDKGQHIAIEVAKAVDLPLVLAGKVDTDRRSQDYFVKKIEPHFGDQVTWLPDVAGEEKKGLLARARAMLFPIAWEEPFGLAMVEAMGSGTPVVAFPRGAAREIVEPGLTGFLGQTSSELAALVRRTDEIDPARCRARVAERFNPGRMTDGYEAAYQVALASHGRAAPQTTWLQSLWRRTAGRVVQREVVASSDMPGSAG
jgi:glycosyltransferase involved in cell wall biosynthesis